MRLNIGSTREKFVTQNKSFQPIIHAIWYLQFLQHSLVKVRAVDKQQRGLNFKSLQKKVCIVRSSEMRYFIILCNIYCFGHYIDERFRSYHSKTVFLFDAQNKNNRSVFELMYRPGCWFLKTRRSLLLKNVKLQIPTLGYKPFVSLLKKNVAYDF